jgi:hypothetical protein
MAEIPRNEITQEASDLLGAARDRGLQQLEGAKGQLAEGAERVASAVERTADEIDGEGDGAISGFGHSVASLMRQLAGGLRERDVEEFARELGALARRNPGVFLAGSVALGFGIARFFKARSPGSSMGASGDRDYMRSDSGEWQDSGGLQNSGGWQGAGGWQDDDSDRSLRTDESTRGMRPEFDDESLDLSVGSTGSSSSPGLSSAPGLAGAGPSASSSPGSSSGSTAAQQSPDDDRNQSKSRQSGKHKAKTQRASSGATEQGGGEPSQNLSGTGERSATEPPPTGGSGGSAFTGGTGGGATRGGKS